ncbi:MAG: hypothetical protein JO355_09240, partial [Planctomycetaceae bacterium]|nr:hypothetical protein [Planctomycetaceae bacterium]
NPDYGARPLRRAIENMVEDPLSEEILRGAFKGLDVIKVILEGAADARRLKFEASTKGESKALAGVGGGTESKAEPKKP